MKLLDFLVVPVRRSGGTAIQRFLSLHPNIIAVPKWTLDSALESGQEEQLLESAQEAMRASPQTRFGLVQHLFTEAGPELEDIVQRLSKIVRKGGLILIFRDHCDAMNSELSHGAILQYCNYDFAMAGLSWPSEINSSMDLDAFLQECKEERPTARDSTDHVSRPENVWKRRLSYVHYAEIQAAYEGYFRNPLIVDYDKIFAPNDKTSMQGIYAFIGVDDKFHMPFFTRQQAGRSHRFLDHNYTLISSDNFNNLQVVMVSRDILDFSIDYSGTEMAILFDKYVEQDLKFPNGLSLVSRSDIDLVNSGPKQQMMLRNDGERMMREFLYPLWRHNFQAVLKEIDKFTNKTLPEDIREDLKEALATDSEHFFATNKHIGQSWTFRS